jgi:murein DD-endopeptidase MepM/ murein hydrolase activator NlpD
MNLSLRHAAAAALGLSGMVVVTAACLFYLALKLAVDARAPEVGPVARLVFGTAPAPQEAQSRKELFVRENLAEMARRIGQMQAQLMRLDALGERVSGLAGVKPQEFTFKSAPGRGGPAPAVLRDVPMDELRDQLAALQASVEQRSDYLNVVEAELIAAQVKRKMEPTNQPVDGYNGSGYGWRIDPFNGRQAFHGGIDFNAPTGTAIVAAAGGVVIAAEPHAGYGNMVMVDHGNDLVTRYAHASRILVKTGDIVRRNQKIAEVGSTGRSTGAHLHFEVHVKGVPVDPNKFLAATQARPHRHVARR